MVELFSGSAILSSRFAAGGFEVMPLDIKQGVDLRRWEPPEGLRGRVTYLHSGPPCQEFSGLAYDYDRVWRADMGLIGRTLELVQALRPRMWSLENVKMLQWLLGQAPYHYGGFFFWGWFPFEYMPDAREHWTRSFKGTHLDRAAGDVRSNEQRTPEERATYPPGLVEALFQAVTKRLQHGYQRRGAA
jgi:hypothetical protein